MSSTDPAEQPFSTALDPSGTIRMEWVPGVAINESMARAAMAATDELCRSTPRPLLVEVSATESVDRPAGAVFGEHSLATRVAPLGPSAVDRVIANFVLTVSRQPVPIKFFTEETAVVVGLKAGLVGGWTRGPPGRIVDIVR